MAWARSGGGVLADLLIDAFHDAGGFGGDKNERVVRDLERYAGGARRAAGQSTNDFLAELLVLRCLGKRGTFRQIEFEYGLAFAVFEPKFGGALLGHGVSPDGR